MTKKDLVLIVLGLLVLTGLLVGYIHRASASPASSEGINIRAAKHMNWLPGKFSLSS